MGKIGLIIKREYVTRVRKPAFILITLLGPLLFAGITVGPVLIAQLTDEVKTIAVVDRSSIFYSALKEKETETIKFVSIPREVYEDEMNNLKDGKSSFHAILFVPITDDGGYQQVIVDKTNDKSRLNIYSVKNVGIGLKSLIENTIKEEIRAQELTKLNVPRDIVAKTDRDIRLNLNTVDSDGKAEQKSAEVNTIIGLLFGMVIYVFIFFYGAMVFRGVIEEKTSRIVEVIVSSVKPFQLMMGKIIGVGLVGLTQFVAWVVLGITISTIAQAALIKDPHDAKHVAQQLAVKPNVDVGVGDNNDQQTEASETFTAINNLPFGKILFAFVFYFLGGYLLYAAFFAAVGGAVDSETDSQQFMLPVTVPIIFSIAMMQFILNNPDGPVAFWLSMIPLTSPIIMMVRIPFDPPIWQVALSMGILVVSFIAATWLAGRIYRTGILMYGKKPSWREIGKWLFYKY